ncbi:MAG: hypothetical protein R3C56_30205 [Pirellulaceae bacterium]
MPRDDWAEPTVNGNVLDVTGDDLLTPIDVLQIVNHLNLHEFFPSYTNRPCWEWRRRIRRSQCGDRSDGKPVD